MSTGPIRLQNHPLLQANTSRLRRRNAGRCTHTVYQEEIEKCLIKRAAVRAAEKELEEIEKYITTALRCGARIEDGSLSADLLEVKRKAYNVGSGSYYQLKIHR